MDPAGSKLILKVSEIVYRYKPLTKDELIDFTNIRKSSHNVTVDVYPDN